jgi:hypothetical protein
MGKAGLARNRRTVRFIIYRFTVELNLPHEFNDEDDLAAVTV